MSEQEYDKEQLRILRNAFKAFDHDERGWIEHNDVQTILEILGQKLDEKAIKNMIKEVDKGNSGKLDFSQFCRLAARFVEVEEDGPALVGELKEAFRVYDKEGKGYLTVQTLRGILRELDDKLSNTDLDMIIDEIDADGSGTVDFDEFLQVMTGKNFYDIMLNRRFVFEPPSRPSPSCCAPPACKLRHCPAQRLHLHRRIEWHFERLFEQMCRPLDVWHTHCARKHLSFESSVQRKTTTGAASSSTSTNASIKSSVCQCQQTKPSKATQTSTASTTSCYRSVFRPRFPKWVPILTLYREIVQSPFRHRSRLMITHR